MKLSQKQKKFSEFFFFFGTFKIYINFKHSPKKDDPHSRCICGNTGYEKHG